MGVRWQRSGRMRDSQRRFNCKPAHIHSMRPHNPAVASSETDLGRHCSCLHDDMKAIGATN